MPNRLKESRFGEPPGTLRAPQNSPTPEIRLTTYNANSFTTKIVSVEDLTKLNFNGNLIYWIDINGLGDVQVIHDLGQLFHIHRLCLEDILHLDQRPKIEFYDQKMFMVNQFPIYNQPEQNEQICAILDGSLVITFQAYSSNRLVPLLKRLDQQKGRIRESDANYLFYCICDVIVDAYFPLLEQDEDIIDTLEEKVFKSKSACSIEEIHRLKRRAYMARRAMWGTRNLVEELLRNPERVPSEILPYWRDIQDHTIRLLEEAELQRELCLGLLELNQSATAHHMNEVMKVLTIIATIFIPLTFIAGVYGMNFNSETSPFNMPELNWYFGYPMAIGLMILTVLGMIYYFKKKNWL